MTDQPHQLPAVAWAFAWSWLVEQVLSMAVHGSQTSDQIPLSVILGALVATWVALGVIRARTIRVAFVWIVLVLAGIAGVLDLADNGPASDLVFLIVTGTQLVLFTKFTRTPYYAWQKSRPRDPGPSLAGMVAIAIAVGVLGGVVGATQDGVHAEVTF